MHSLFRLHSTIFIHLQLFCSFIFTAYNLLLLLFLLYFSAHQFSIFKSISLDVNVYYPSFSIIFLTNPFYMNLLISSLQISPTHHSYTISLLIFLLIFTAIIICYYHCCLLKTSIVYGFYLTIWYLLVS